MPKTPGDVRQLAKEAKAKIVDLKFTDLPGVWQHFSIPMEGLNDELFEEGIGFDGSTVTCCWSLTLRQPVSIRSLNPHAELDLQRAGSRYASTLQS